MESEITAFFAVLAMSDELKRALLAMGLCDVLVPLTSSDNVEVQGNSAAAISNLSSMGILPLPSPIVLVNYSGRLLIFCKNMGHSRRWIARIPTTVPSK